MNQLRVIENQSKRVLLTSQLAESYGTESKVISNNFNRNYERYIEGKHYFLLQGNTLKQFKETNPQIDESLNKANKLYLWTEKGAFLHAKSLNTDQAWEVYDKLVESYFDKPKLLSEKEQLIAAMRLSIEHEEKFQEHGERIAELETKVQERITLESGEQRKLQKCIAKKVYSLTEDSDTRKKLFSEIYRELRDRFGVASYKDIKSHELESAVGYVNAWIPKKTA